jgi:2-dehydro-3-deoxyphosphogluconate aldolase/(4S)-4-hydroxy-2-oxoglutarate aldolase
MENILEKLGELGVIPVVRIENSEQAVNLGHALIRGGLPCAEITFRTAAAEEAISTLVSELPEILVGAGTVLNKEQARGAVSAGARFIVSPGFSPEVVDWCLENEIPVTPGIATPTEIMMALERGIGVLKFFPANLLGGPTAIKAISAAFTEVKFIPTGGVSADNLASYLGLRAVHACGGSWLVKSDLIATGNFDKITELAREAANIIRIARTGGE